MILKIMMSFMIYDDFYIDFGKKRLIPDKQFHETKPIIEN
jgi:hypothetical protein